MKKFVQQMVFDIKNTLCQVQDYLLYIVIAIAHCQVNSDLVKSYCYLQCY